MLAMMMHETAAAADAKMIRHLYGMPRAASRAGDIFGASAALHSREILNRRETPPPSFQGAGCGMRCRKLTGRDSAHSGSMMRRRADERLAGRPPRARWLPMHFGYDNFAHAGGPMPATLYGKLGYGKRR